MSRTGAVQFAFEALGSFSRINRRMHNKTWIADNRIAIVGGRNLGNEYFGASEEVNFVDLDFAMVGPIVRDASASFDRYWNSRGLPHGVLAPGDVTTEALEKLRKNIASRVAQTAARALCDRIAQQRCHPAPGGGRLADDWTPVPLRRGRPGGRRWARGAVSPGRTCSPCSRPP